MFKENVIGALDIAVSMMLTGVNVSNAHTEEEPFVVDLIPGQHTLIKLN